MRNSNEIFEITAKLSTTNRILRFEIRKTGQTLRLKENYQRNIGIYCEKERNKLKLATNSRKTWEKAGVKVDDEGFNKPKVTQAS